MRLWGFTTLGLPVRVLFENKQYKPQMNTYRVLHVSRYK